MTQCMAGPLHRCNTSASLKFIPLCLAVGCYLSHFAIHFFQIGEAAMNICLKTTTLQGRITYPTWEKENHRLKSAISGRGYIILVPWTQK